MLQALLRTTTTDDFDEVLTTAIQTVNPQIPLHERSLKYYLLVVQYQRFLDPPTAKPFLAFFPLHFFSSTLIPSRFEYAPARQLILRHIELILNKECETLDPRQRNALLKVYWSVHLNVLFYRPPDMQDDIYEEVLQTSIMQTYELGTKPDRIFNLIPVLAPDSLLCLAEIATKFETTPNIGQYQRELCQTHTNTVLWAFIAMNLGIQYLHYSQATCLQPFFATSPGPNRSAMLQRSAFQPLMSYLNNVRENPFTNVAQTPPFLRRFPGAQFGPKVRLNPDPSTESEKPFRLIGELHSANELIEYNVLGSIAQTPGYMIINPLYLIASLFPNSLRSLVFSMYPDATSPPEVRAKYNREGSLFSLLKTFTDEPTTKGAFIYPNRYVMRMLQENAHNRQFVQDITSPIGQRRIYGKTIGYETSTEQIITNGVAAFADVSRRYEGYRDVLTDLATAEAEPEPDTSVTVTVDVTTSEELSPYWLSNRMQKYLNVPDSSPIVVIKYFERLDDAMTTESVIDEYVLGGREHILIEIEEILDNEDMDIKSQLYSKLCGIYWRMLFLLALHWTPNRDETYNNLMITHLQELHNGFNTAQDLVMLIPLTTPRSLLELARMDTVSAATWKYGPNTRKMLHNNVTALLWTLIPMHLAISYLIDTLPVFRYDNMNLASIGPRKFEMCNIKEFESLMQYLSQRRPFPFGDINDNITTALPAYMTELEKAGIHVGPRANYKTAPEASLYKLFCEDPTSSDNANDPFRSRIAEYHITYTEDARPQYLIHPILLIGLFFPSEYFTLRSYVDKHQGRFMLRYMDAVLNTAQQSLGAFTYPDNDCIDYLVNMAIDNPDMLNFYETEQGKVKLYGATRYNEQTQKTINGHSALFELGSRDARIPGFVFQNLVLGIRGIVQKEQEARERILSARGDASAGASAGASARVAGAGTGTGAESTSGAGVEGAGGSVGLPLMRRALRW